MTWLLVELARSWRSANPSQERNIEMTITTVTTITAQVTDTNPRPKGAMPVQVEFDGEGPVRAQHAG